jgi:hypothetical protein
MMNLIFILIDKNRIKKKDYKHNRLIRFQHIYIHEEEIKILMVTLQVKHVLFV